MPLPPMWFPVEREAELPPVYAWIAGREDVRALLELPIGHVFAETAAMYRASGHWKPIVNGYSGYSPPPYPEVFGALSGHPFRPPDATILDRLGGWGVTHILVRSGSYRQPEERRALAEWEAASRADLVYDREGDRVYALNALRARQVRSPR
jgi:hypothetical protein